MRGTIDDLRKALFGNLNPLDHATDIRSNIRRLWMMGWPIKHPGGNIPIHEKKEERPIISRIDEKWRQ
jgi:hypothetical protein